MIIVRHVLFTPRSSNYCAIFIFSRCLIGLCSSVFDFNSNSIKVERLGELRCIVSSKQRYTSSALETTCFSSGNAKHDIVYRGWKREVSAYQKWCNFCGSEDLSFKTVSKSTSFVFCRSNKNKNNKDSWFVLDVKIQYNKLIVNEKVLKNQFFWRLSRKIILECKNIYFKVFLKHFVRKIWGFWPKDTCPSILEKYNRLDSIFANKNRKQKKHTRKYPPDLNKSLLHRWK